MPEPNENVDNYTMVNIWVALEDIESHPLAIVTNPNWENFTPPKGYFQKSVDHPNDSQLIELCKNGQHLNYLIKDMKAYDAMIF